MKAENQPKEHAVKFLAQHIKQGEKPTACVRKLLNKYPTLTRPQTYNSAAEVGINIHTAKNVWNSMMEYVQ